MAGLALSFSIDNPPLAVLAVARVASVPLAVDSALPAGSAPILRFIDSSGSKAELSGLPEILRFVGRNVDNPHALYDHSAEESREIDVWLNFAPTFSSGPEFESACANVNGYLLLRTFLVGHSISIADFIIWSGLAATGQRWASLKKSNKYPNLARWFDSIESQYNDALTEVTSTYVGKRGVGKPLSKAVDKTGNAENASNGSVGAKDKTTTASEVDLPGAKVGQVRLRFAPEPSGYLHIGHAKAALLNHYFAQRYKGDLILRFDDTNPAKESNEFVENLIKDVATLGIEYSKITYTTDYFPQLMDMAEKLMKEGKAYVDDTPREIMQKERMDGIESRCRNQTKEENLALWKEMIAGSERGMQCCVRGKLDMQDPNKSLRDPVYFRCNNLPHHRIGDKYKAYPTYDFACPFVDATEGITHALRSSEYHDRNAQYYRILSDMGLRHVEIYEFSRLNMVYTLLSKRKLKWFVEMGIVDGWDDPRFPTVQGIVRRGLKIDALIEFILQQGASKNLNLMEWDKLWTINKKIIDPVCARHTAVNEDKRVLLELSDGPEKPFVRVIPRHKKYEGAGTKATTYTKRIWLDFVDASVISLNEEVTLMDWGNAIIKEIEKDGEGNVVLLKGVLHLEGSVKTTKLKLTWLPETEELVRLSLVEYGYLITKKKLEEDEEVTDFLNPCSKKETAALGDSNMRNLKHGEIIQLERRGYFKCDVPFLRTSKPIVLVGIPDGRQVVPPPENLKKP
ncbi:glutamyl/glutaminyl-tRNA synthetase, class Ic [Wolffia australiana]